MKKAVAILICVVLSLVFVCPAIAESEEYLKVTSEDVEFLSEYGNNVLFTLKSGVYVKYLGNKNDCYIVEYCGAKGYVKVSDFSQDIQRYSNLTQYYHTPITVHFTEDAVSKERNFLCVLPNVEFPAEQGLTHSTQDNFNLIGSYSDGNNTFLYLSFQKTDGSIVFGSVNKSHTDWNEQSNPITPPPVISAGNNQTTVTNPENTHNNEPQTAEPTNNLVRVILIIGICIPAFLIVYLIFKPVTPSTKDKNPRRRQDDYEDFE